jgi:hypothetical protein
VLSLAEDEIGGSFRNVGFIKKLNEGKCKKRWLWQKAGVQNSTWSVY